MPNRETTIIPLDAAHEILAAFQIAPSHHAYLRWKRDDGFRWVDFEGVLSASPLFLVVDWTEWLQDAVEFMIDQLHMLDVHAVADMSADGDEGYVAVNGGERAIKYVPNDDDNFDAVVQEINLLIAPTAQYRKLRSSEGSDGWVYALLPVAAWNSLERTVPHWTNVLFAKLPTQLLQKVR